MGDRRIERLSPSDWDPSRLGRLLNQMVGLRILVVGDVGLDRYTLGTVERISPEAPVPIVRVDAESFKLGLAANVADNIQALGGRPQLTGVVGSDHAAADFRFLLRSANISGTHLITDRSRRTILKERIVSDRQQLLRVDYESQHPVSAKTTRELVAKIRGLLPKCDAVILQDYAKGLIHAETAHEIYRLARKAGKLLAADPHVKHPMDAYRGADVVTPNSKEAEALTGIRLVDEDSLLEAGRKLLRGTRARHVVITRGKDGMAIFSAGQRKTLLIPTYAREVYDVSGAGDTVISVLTLALAAGASIQDACVLGNLAAGVEVGKRGTATVSGDEIREAMELVAR